jgi:hypothetical protein
MRWLIAVLLILSGCSPSSPQAVLEDYQQRVANVLEQELALVQPATTLPLPSRRARQQQLAETRGGLLDTLELRHCGLLPLIAERNSSLGKVKPPSQLLSYELRFFTLLQRCYRQDQQRPLLDMEFSQQLALLYRLKQANLPGVFWNAVFTSIAIERNLSLSRPPLPLTGHPGYGDSLRALQLLNRIGAGLDPPAQTYRQPDRLAQLEEHYEALHHSEYGSQLFTSLRLLIDTLNRTAATIEQRLAQRPLCLRGRTPQAQYLKNVFDRYYTAKLQGYLSQVYRQGRPWLEQLNRLAVMQPSSEAFDAFRQQMLNPEAKQGLWQQFEQALERHTQSWQRVLTECGMMPGTMPG